MASRRYGKTKTCPECSAPFRPYHTQQVCCSRPCGAARRHRLRPEWAAAWVKQAQAARFAQYRTRLAERLRGLTPAQIWRQAYTRGYSAALARVRRGVEAA